MKTLPSPTGLSVIAALLLCVPCRAEDKVVRVSAAASLGDVLKAIDADFEKETGIKVELNLAASNALARQIEEGAPVDVFFSADLAKMDGLEKLGRIDAATREDQLSNGLVVVAPADSQLKVAAGRDLAGEVVKKLAVGDPKGVPAGIYAKEWLTKLGVWSAVEPKLIATESVRAALAAVESGNVDAGIVYKTDASISRKVKIVLEVPADEAPQITYPMALIEGAAHAEAGKKYLDHLDSPQAVRLFNHYGFVVLPERGAAR